MNTFIVVTAEALMIARKVEDWDVETHLSGKAPECLGVDPANPAHIVCGTWGHGLWRSTDGGRSWAQAGESIPYDVFTSVVFDRQTGALYAGTQPSTLFRSDDGGESWRELRTLKELPSSSTWSFPPNPSTHHVRWIEIDLSAPGRMYAAIEAGALVRSFDGGSTWHDRVAGGPFDTHTAAAHPVAAGRVYSAAGDGYYESLDAGATWERGMAGLQHGYLVGLAVDPQDPETVLVSAASSPRVAYTSSTAEAYVYRKSGGGPFALVTDGLPHGPGTTASRFAWHPAELGLLYAANNRGLFRSEDVGLSWEPVELPWPDRPFSRGAKTVAVLNA